MKVVLLAGGAGTRISEESIYKPKPMVEIGGKPILWHIMKEYSHYGFHDFHDRHLSGYLFRRHEKHVQLFPELPVQLQLYKLPFFQDYRSRLSS